MQYTIRKAMMADFSTIEAIYARARKFMAETGNPSQWGTKNPPADVLAEDIRRGELYVLTDDSGIHGVFYFAMGEDPTYGVIEEGGWLSDEPYGTIHRIASDGSGGIFAGALGFCKARSAHLRIDTHRDNLVMQHLVEKHGFSRRGIIFTGEGSPRLAYEYIG